MEVFHVFNKSIAGFKIFNSDKDFKRIVDAIAFYRVKDPSLKFSLFNTKSDDEKLQFYRDGLLNKKIKLVDVVAYCIMPTHFHIILQQHVDGGISTFMNNVANSYARYFNVKTNRKGPLWEGRFKRVEVKNDEQLLHVTRYVHLNPVTAYLVDKPEQWPASSYLQYIEPGHSGICCFKSLLDITTDEYREFTEDQISYQRELAGMKEHIFD